MRPARSHYCMLAALTAALNCAQAEDAPWPLCPIPFVAIPALPPSSAKATETHVESDRAETRGEGAKSYTFLGNGLVRRGDQWVRAERIDYREDTSEASARGAVQMGQGDLLLQGDAAQIWFDQNRATIDQARFFLPQRHARGDADRAEFRSKTEATLTGMRYTTCNAGDDSWYLHGRTLTLDTANNVGTATHVWVDFHGVPFLYFPYLNFPLAGRKSGLLFPTFGRSSTLGTRVAVPFYWNIAPNLDATLTLQNLTDRGQQWLGQFRYLQPNYRGEMNFEVLPDDKVTDQDRVYTELRHLWTPSARWVNTIDYRRASDGDYFDDFGDRLSSTSVVHLERSARSSYSSDLVRLQGNVLDYQTLDETVLPSQRPYRKLPEITLSAGPPQSFGGFRAQVDAAAVNFERADRVSGARLNVNPSVSYPIDGVAGFLRPKLGARYTAYALRNASSTVDDRPARATSVFSVDGGLYFDREMNWFGERWQQTLEPRAFYLYVPYHDQSNQIVDANGAEQRFDTELNGFSYGQLFSENRFSGGDRDGDADQVALALTTRVLDARGAERLSASIGRLFYFRDREVVLPGGAFETAPYSNVVGELTARPIPFLSATVTAQYSSDLDTVTESVTQLRYQPQRRKIANVALRLAKDANGEFTQHETDVSIFWPIHTHWNFIGRRNYSLRDHRHKEWLAGLEYDSCCWALRLVTRSYVTNLEDAQWAEHAETNRTLMLQLELKGLSSVGQNIQSLLENQEHGIAGY